MHLIEVICEGFIKELLLGFSLVLFANLGLKHNICSASWVSTVIPIAKRYTWMWVCNQWKRNFDSLNKFCVGAVISVEKKRKRKPRSGSISKYIWISNQMWKCRSAYVFMMANRRLRYNGTHIYFNKITESIEMVEHLFRHSVYANIHKNRLKYQIGW